MLAIIPARGGSKGLPGKNIRPLNGKPLIAYTIQAALKSKYISDVYISTDDTGIYDTALKFGAKSSFLRPDYLAKDDSLAVDNYIYTLARLNEEFGEKIDDFVVLQPTSPLRTTEYINGAIELYRDKNADSVISYTEEHHPVSWHKYLDESQKFINIFPEDIKNRQDFRASYYPNGAIFVFSFDLIKRKQYYSDNSFAYIMPRNCSVDIDTLEDFEYAEFLLGRHQ